MSDNIYTFTYSYRWPPLESDPAIFNKYFQEVGLPDYIGFQELVSLDPTEILGQFSHFPIFGIIAAINRNKNSITNTSDNILPWNSIPFFMRQTRELDNACGLISALHLFGNYLENLNPLEDSILKKFFNKSSNLNPFERAKFLEDFTDFKFKHHVYAYQGQSFLPNQQRENIKIAKEREIVHHFISIVNIEDNLVELDGTQPGPVLLKKKISNENFLIEVVEEFNKRINQGIIGEDLSILLLTYM